MRILAAALFFPAALFAARSTTSFNDGWSFAKDPSNAVAVQDAEKLPFTPVTVPHDWAIAGPFEPMTVGDTGKLPWKGTGWYRKTLTCTTNELEACRAGASIVLAFDGVMARSRVFVNGRGVAANDYGYIGFEADLTPYLVPGENTILVKADTLAHGSRWYPGAGIYRRVRSIRRDAVRLGYESVFVKPRLVKDKGAVVDVAFTVENAGPKAVRDIVCTIEVVAPDGTVVASNATTRALMVPAYGSRKQNLSAVVAEPVLWKAVDPAPLYTARVTVKSAAAEDAEEVRFGIRTMKFDTNRGFFLNGERTQLNGVCLHADLGILGMAFNKSAMRRQLKVMRSMGVNALRTSHNAPAPELLDLCDEMGIVVWDECFDKWDDKAGRGPETPMESYIEDYLCRFVRRDRNHPCVAIWSIGNEIDSWEPHTSPLARTRTQSVDGTTPERCARFRSAMLEEDNTRPVGIASCEWYELTASRGDYDALDVVGYNYSGRYSFYRKLKPNKPVICSESSSCVSSYGYYADELPTNRIDFSAAPVSGEVDSMDYNAAPWGDPPEKEFERMARDKYCGGEFVWMGIDYLGEPYPVCKWHPEFETFKTNELARSAYFGVCDLLVFPKDRYYIYRSHWLPEEPTLHIAPAHWTFPGREGKKRPVFVYSNADEVELFLNGKSLGRVKKDTTFKSAPDTFWNIHDFEKENYYGLFKRYRFIFEDVVYEPGELKAVAYRRGAKYLEESLHTAGKPAAVVLEPEADTLSPDGETYVFAKVTVADGKGVPVPSAKDRISFKLEGPGEILSVGNADPRGYDPFKDTASHPLFFGRAGLVVRRLPGREGPITLTASAAGMQPASFTFK